MTQAPAASTVPVEDFLQLTREHAVLLSAHGAAQRRCSRVISDQQARIDRLEAQAMRLRAAVILRETALAFAREDRAALETSIPGLPRRLTLARRVETLLERIQVLMRERLQPAPNTSAALAERPVPQLPLPAGPLPAGPLPGDPLGDLTASLVAADLVICQTGCLSHGDYWRVQDHCKRTGKACMLVARPEALRIVRIRGPLAGTPVASLPLVDTSVDLDSHVATPTLRT